MREKREKTQQQSTTARQKCIPNCSDTEEACKCVKETREGKKTDQHIRIDANVEGRESIYIEEQAKKV